MKKNFIAAALFALGLVAVAPASAQYSDPGPNYGGGILPRHSRGLLPDPDRYEDTRRNSGGLLPDRSNDVTCRSETDRWGNTVASPHISQVSRCAGWVRAGGWFRTWPARVPAAVGGWAGSTMVSLVAGLVESRSQAAAALRNRA